MKFLSGTSQNWYKGGEMMNSTTKQILKDLGYLLAVMAVIAVIDNLCDAQDSLHATKLQTEKVLNNG
jgi:hypothetical protein